MYKGYISLFIESIFKQPLPWFFIVLLILIVLLQNALIIICKKFIPVPILYFLHFALLLHANVHVYISQSTGSFLYDRNKLIISSFMLYYTYD